MDVVTDEEQQQTLTILLARLQDDVRDLRDKTEFDMRAACDNLQKEMHEQNELLQNDIQDLHNKMHTLEEAKTELQGEVTQLKQQLRQASTTTTSGGVMQPTETPSSSLMAIPSIFQRNVISHDGLPPDTFTLMMISPLLSQAWLLGLFAFAFQMVLIFMIASNQLKELATSSDFNIPFKVESIVSAGQLLTIIFALVTQNDIITSIRLLVMFWKNPHWDNTVLQREEDSRQTTSTEWLVHIILPNILKFSQGILVMLITFVVIVQSDNIIDLLTEFTALMVLSETDNIFFLIAINGYLGAELQMKAIQARGIKIQYEFSEINSNADQASSQPVSTPTKDFLIRPIILFLIATAMIGCWLRIVSNQVNGIYFYQRYPQCNMSNAFQLATENFGDGICYGGLLNTLGCEFEGGDCVDFNLAFPLCKGENRTDVQLRVGDGNCDHVFMNVDCDYDGGDCCPYDIINDPSFGDGQCDERANTEKCGYDNGDCFDYNRDFPGCPYDIVFGNNPSLFGDSQCNGGILSTEGCGYDHGDCDEFILAQPDCPLDYLSKMEDADKTVIGDSLCDSGIYNIEKCGYEFGDCNRGQIGQTLLITDDIEYNSELYLSKSLSLDGTTMALGMYNTNEDGNYDYENPGLVKVWRYNDIKKMWLQLGSHIVGIRSISSEDMALSFSGNRIAISSFSGKLQVFDFNKTSGGEWFQVGQTIVSTMTYSDGVASITADGSRVALVHSEEEIRIYSLKTTSAGQEWVVDDVHNVINPGADFRPSILKFNSLDGFRLLIHRTPSWNKAGVTKVFQFDPNGTTKTWTQMGLDVESLLSTPPAISADGNRIALPSNSTAPGQVSVFDYDARNDEWILVGNPIKSSSSSDGDGFGYSINMSSDGNLIVIGSNSPNCRQYNRFNVNKCMAGSVELYIYQPYQHRFQKVPPNSASPHKANGNMIKLADLSDSSIFGLHFSMSGDNTMLSISGYDVDNENAFVEVYDLNELFYTKCAVNVPHVVGTGVCADWPPYNTEACGFDGGDCDQKPVEDYANCFVHRPEQVGDGDCTDSPPYNTEACGFDGGDCL